MARTIEPDDQEIDTLRLLELAKKHGLRFVKSGTTFSFDDFTAHGLQQRLVLRKASIGQAGTLAIN